MASYHIKSMTGFGHAQRETARGRFSAEVRTINSRFQDVSISLPRELALLETALRQLLQQEIPRGKVDCRVRFVPSGEQVPQVIVNKELARHYVEQLKQLTEIGVDGAIPLQVLANLPGVIETVPCEFDEQVMWRYLRGVVEQAIEALNRERLREGNALAEQLRALGAQMRAAKREIDVQKDLVVDKFRRRLSARLDQLKAEYSADLEPSRLELEVAMFADRSDITEELTRLEAHLERFEELLRTESDETIGRNLEFLIQEFLREINTICSKARDTEVITQALEMKNLVEKMREQSQNIQ